MKDNKEYSLLDFDFSKGRKKLKVVLTYFNEVPKIDIREYYYDESDGTFKHSKKGIQLDPQKAEALRLALEKNASIIDKHLISEDLEGWVKHIKKIETSADFFSDFEFFKTVSTGVEEMITFNSNHPFGKRIMEIEKEIQGNKSAEELMTLVKCLLVSYNHSLNQYEEGAKVNLGDFIQDHNQTWSSLLKRVLKAVK